MGEKIKVLHLIKSLGRGGAEMLLPETLKVHSKEQFEFHFAYFLPWKDQMVPAIEALGAKVICFTANNNLKMFLKVNEINRYVQENNINVIHSHLPWAGIIARIVGRMTSVPIIYTEHNKWERYHKLTYFINKFTFGWQQLAIAVSKDVEQSIKKHYKNKKPEIITVLNGVNTEKFNRFVIEDNLSDMLNITEDTIVIGTVSVFRTQKRLTIWLEIAHLIHKKYPNTYFIIVGDGPLRAQVHAKAEELKMQDYLYFAGLQEEVRPYFKVMDIFMMASEFEGLPIALLEAMSMQCIPCCTTAGGIPEVIKNNENGLLVNVEEPFELMNKISCLINNWKISAERLKQAARITVEAKFGMERMVEKLEDNYKKIAKFKLN